MTQPPKWFRVVAILALLWNLIGCAAYLSDVMMTPEAAAKLSAAQQELYNSRPSWAVAATATAVWLGALGSFGLIVRKRWATILLAVSLLGVLVQNYWLFLASPAASVTGPAAMAIQGVVLIISIALVALSLRAAKRGWLT
ncbi:MAG: hypothetical protein WA208_05115 [Thermoanaerobaculia bacterium]